MLDTPFYCAAGQIKTPAFLFDWAAPQTFRICGIFFALTREISLAAVRQASGTCGAYLRLTLRKYAPHKFRASSSKNLAASAPFVAHRSFSLVIYLRSSTKLIRKQNRERCSFPRSPWLSTSNGLEKFHGAKCICVKCYLQRLISMI